MIRDLIIKNRSYRRFDTSIRLSDKQIESWIELARFSASGRNMQPLKYAISTNEMINRKIFPQLAWAGYLKDWNGPEEKEQPVAYVAVLLDKSLANNHYCDDGIAMQSILLGAVTDGYGGCILGSVKRSEVAKILQLPENVEILWMIALGKPSETVLLETAQKGDIVYWRDEKGVHHVPKRPLDEIIIKTS